MPARLFSNARRIALASILLAAAMVYLVRWQERAEVTLILGAGPAGSEAFGLAQAVADVVQTHHPRIRILVVPTQGSAQNAELMRTGGLDLATIQAEVGTPSAARLIAPLFSNALHLLVREGSGIRSPGDMRGKTVAVPLSGSAGFGSFWSVASHYGMDEAALTALPMSLEAATWAMRSGAVDALFLSRPPGSSALGMLTWFPWNRPRPSGSIGPPWRSAWCPGDRTGATLPSPRRTSPPQWYPFC